ncbi:hypothetical protein BGZ76_010593, partial [Entomortierella beljakovae]
MTSEIKLICVVDGDSTSFPVVANLNDTFGDLKISIKKARSSLLKDIIDPSDLTLWHVTLPSWPKRQITVNNLENNEKRELDAASDVSDIFNTSPPKKTIHIIVQCPLPIGTQETQDKRVVELEKQLSDLSDMFNSDN